MWITHLTIGNQKKKRVDNYVDKCVDNFPIFVDNFPDPPKTKLST